LFFVRADIGTPLALDDLDVRRFAIPSTTSKFDLSLRVTETRDGLICSLQYDTDIFETSTAERIVAHFGNLLHGIVERPDAPIAQLPMLSPAEFAHIVGELNATDAPYDNDATLAQRFERQVERAPDAIAVVDAEGALTYRELNARANALAHALRARGVGRGDVIGLCMDRSISMVMGTLAIVKAGGAYLPLDAQYPADRLAYMVSNSGARIVIARRDARSVAAGLDGVTVLDVEDPAYRDGNAENPPSITTPDDLVYIIYTSGSTGRPKGVPIPGRGVSRLVIGTNYITFEPNDIVAQVCNYSFDVTTFEVWGALLNGARLVVLANEVILDPAAFAAALPAHDINVLFLTGALFRYMASAVPAAFAQLRALVVGGEAIDPAAARAVLTAGAPHRLINGYGPTEATTFACTYDIRLPVPEPIPIGRPIANTQAFVLDRDRNIVPPGVTGELYLGGPGLARGYLNEPELTARKFIAHPFSDVPGDRLYATGDVARLLADGNIEYLGRADRQVKVRGFRIEIDEIETALKAVHGVRDAVVDVRLDSFGEKRIIAFVIAGNGAPTSLEAWHQSLRATLPGYMLPSAVVPVAEFPRTANGKLDIAALTAPDIRGETASRLVLARPELYQLIGLWSDLLGVQTIAPADNFFEIGGHSLLAARMLAQVRAIFGRSVPLAAFFANPTLENLAGLLSASAAEPDAAESKLVEIRAEGSRVPFFLLHGDLAGGGYYARKLVRGLAPDQPFFVLMPHGLGGAHVPTHFEAMARDYAAEILARFPTGPYIVGGYCFGGIVAVEVARILRAANATVCHVVLLDAPTSNARGTTVAEGLDRVARALRVNEGRRDALRDGVGLTVNLAERIAARLRKLRDRIDVSRRGFRLKPPITQIARDDEDPLLRPLYVVAQRYVQRRYAGPITLIVPADERPYRLQAIADWKAVAPQVSVDFVPGEHLTCVTTYVDETAACINAVLERSQPTRLE
jgi:amino acid adenylation domain-containing protein